MTVGDSPGLSHPVPAAPRTNLNLPFQEGDSTIDARTNLLKEAREQILETKKKYDVALEKLNYKIGRYEIAQKTGKLTWEDA